MRRALEYHTQDSGWSVPSGMSSDTVRRTLEPGDVYSSDTCGTSSDTMRRTLRPGDAYSFRTSWMRLIWLEYHARDTLARQCLKLQDKQDVLEYHAPDTPAGRCL